MSLSTHSRYLTVRCWNFSRRHHDPGPIGSPATRKKSQLILYLSPWVAPSRPSSTITGPREPRTQNATAGTFDPPPPRLTFLFPKRIDRVSEILNDAMLARTLQRWCSFILGRYSSEGAVQHLIKFGRF